MSDDLNLPDSVLPQEQPSKPSGLFNALSWIRDLAFTVLIAVILIVFIYQPVKVEGTSMMPTLTDQERIFINKFTYHFGIGDIQRGDMVVFWFPLRSAEIVHQARDRRARRHRGDRSPGRSSSTASRWSRAMSRTSIATGVLSGARRCPGDNYFVLGDHRSSSNDSRTWGFVDRKFIYGKAVFVYWPLDKMGRLH